MVVDPESSGNLSSQSVDESFGCVELSSKEESSLQLSGSESDNSTHLAEKVPETQPFRTRSSSPQKLAMLGVPRLEQKRLVQDPVGVSMEMAQRVRPSTEPNDWPKMSWQRRSELVANYKESVKEKETLKARLGLMQKVLDSYKRAYYEKRRGAGESGSSGSSMALSSVEEQIEVHSKAGSRGRRTPDVSFGGDPKKEQQHAENGENVQKSGIQAPAAEVKESNACNHDPTPVKSVPGAKVVSPQKKSSEALVSAATLEGLTKDETQDRSQPGKKLSSKAQPESLPPTLSRKASEKKSLPLPTKRADAKRKSVAPTPPVVKSTKASEEPSRIEMSGTDSMLLKKGVPPAGKSPQRKNTKTAQDTSRRSSASKESEEKKADESKKMSKTSSRSNLAPEKSSPQKHAEEEKKSPTKGSNSKASMPVKKEAKKGDKKEENKSHTSSSSVRPSSRVSQHENVDTAGNINGSNSSSSPSKAPEETISRNLKTGPEKTPEKRSTSQQVRAAVVSLDIAAVAADSHEKRPPADQSQNTSTVDMTMMTQQRTEDVAAVQAETHELSQKDGNQKSAKTLGGEPRVGIASDPTTVLNTEESKAMDDLSVQCVNVNLFDDPSKKLGSGARSPRSAASTKYLASLTDRDNSPASDCKARINPAIAAILKSSTELAAPPKSVLSTNPIGAADTQAAEISAIFPEKNVSEGPQLQLLKEPLGKSGPESTLTYYSAATSSPDTFRSGAAKSPIPPPLFAVQTKPELDLLSSGTAPDAVQGSDEVKDKIKEQPTEQIKAEETMEEAKNSVRTAVRMDPISEDSRDSSPTPNSDTGKSKISSQPEANAKSAEMFVAKEENRTEIAKKLGEGEQKKHSGLDMFLSPEGRGSDGVNEKLKDSGNDKPKKKPIGPGSTEGETKQKTSAAENVGPHPESKEAALPAIGAAKIDTETGPAAAIRGTEQSPKREENAKTVAKVQPATGGNVPHAENKLEPLMPPYATAPQAAPSSESEKKTEVPVSSSEPAKLPAMETPPTPACPQKKESSAPTVNSSTAPVSTEIKERETYEAATVAQSTGQSLVPEPQAQVQSLPNTAATQDADRQYETVSPVPKLIVPTQAEAGTVPPAVEVKVEAQSQPQINPVAPEKAAAVPAVTEPHQQKCNADHTGPNPDSALSAVSGHKEALVEPKPLQEDQHSPQLKVPSPKRRPKTPSLNDAQRFISPSATRSAARTPSPSGGKRSDSCKSGASEKNLSHKLQMDDVNAPTVDAVADAKGKEKEKVQNHEAESVAATTTATVQIQSEAVSAVRQIRPDAPKAGEESKSVPMTTSAPMLMQRADSPRAVKEEKKDGQQLLPNPESKVNVPASDLHPTAEEFKTEKSEEQHDTAPTHNLPSSHVVPEEQKTAAEPQVSATQNPASAADAQAPTQSEPRSEDIPRTPAEDVPKSEAERENIVDPTEAPVKSHTDSGKEGDDMRTGDVDSRSEKVRADEASRPAKDESEAIVSNDAGAHKVTENDMHANEEQRQVAAHAEEERTKEPAAEKSEPKPREDTAPQAVAAEFTTNAHSPSATQVAVRTEEKTRHKVESTLNQESQKPDTPQPNAHSAETTEELKTKPAALHAPEEKAAQHTDERNPESPIHPVQCGIDNSVPHADEGQKDTPHAQVLDQPDPQQSLSHQEEEKHAFVKPDIAAVDRTHAESRCTHDAAAKSERIPVAAQSVESSNEPAGRHTPDLRSGPEIAHDRRRARSAPGLRGHVAGSDSPYSAEKLVPKSDAAPTLQRDTLIPEEHVHDPACKEHRRAHTPSSRSDATCTKSATRLERSSKVFSMVPADKHVEPSADIRPESAHAISAEREHVPADEKIDECASNANPAAVSDKGQDAKVAETSVDKSRTPPAEATVEETHVEPGADVRPKSAHAMSAEREHIIVADMTEEGANNAAGPPAGLPSDAKAIEAALDQSKTPAEAHSSQSAVPADFANPKTENEDSTRIQPDSRVPATVSEEKSRAGTPAEEGDKCRHVQALPQEKDEVSCTAARDVIVPEVASSAETTQHMREEEKVHHVMGESVSAPSKPKYEENKSIVLEAAKTRIEGHPDLAGERALAFEQGRIEPSAVLASSSTPNPNIEYVPPAVQEVSPAPAVVAQESQPIAAAPAEEKPKLAEEEVVAQVRQDTSGVHDSAKSLAETAKEPVQNAAVVAAADIPAEGQDKAAEEKVVVLPAHSIPKQKVDTEGMAAVSSELRADVHADDKPKTNEEECTEHSHVQSAESEHSKPKDETDANLAPAAADSKKLNADDTPQLDPAAGQKVPAVAANTAVEDKLEAPTNVMSPELKNEAASHQVSAAVGEAKQDAGMIVSETQPKWTVDPKSEAEVAISLNHDAAQKGAEPCRLEQEEKQVIPTANGYSKPEEEVSSSAIVQAPEAKIDTVPAPRVPSSADVAEEQVVPPTKPVPGQNSAIPLSAEIRSQDNIPAEGVPTPVQVSQPNTAAATEAHERVASKMIEEEKAHAESTHIIVAKAAPAVEPAHDLPCDIPAVEPAAEPFDKTRAIPRSQSGQVPEKVQRMSAVSVLSPSHLATRQSDSLSSVQESVLHQRLSSVKVKSGEVAESEPQPQENADTKISRNLTAQESTKPTEDIGREKERLEANPSVGQTLPRIERIHSDEIAAAESGNKLGPQEEAHEKSEELQDNVQSDVKDPVGKFCVVTGGEHTIEIQEEGMQTEIEYVTQAEYNNVRYERNNNSRIGGEQTGSSDGAAGQCARLHQHAAGGRQRPRGAPEECAEDRARPPASHGKA